MQIYKCIHQLAHTYMHIRTYCLGHGHGHGHGHGLFIKTRVTEKFTPFPRRVPAVTPTCSELPYMKCCLSPGGVCILELTLWYLIIIEITRDPGRDRDRDRVHAIVLHTNRYMTTSTYMYTRTHAYICAHPYWPTGRIRQVDHAGFIVICLTVTVTVTDNLLQYELQKSSHPSPVVSRLLRRPV